MIALVLDVAAPVADVESLNGETLMVSIWKVEALPLVPRYIGSLHLRPEELRTLKAIAQLVSSMTSKVSLSWSGLDVVPAQLPTSVTAITAPLKRITKRFL